MRDGWRLRREAQRTIASTSLCPRLPQVLRQAALAIGGRAEGAFHQRPSHLHLLGVESVQMKGGDHMQPNHPDPQEGRHPVCDHYRGIALGDICVKVLAITILNEIQPA